MALSALANIHHNNYISSLTSLDVYTPYVYSEIMATAVSTDSSIVPPTTTVSSLTTRNRYCIKTNDTYLQVSDLYAVEFDTTLVSYKNYMTKIFQTVADSVNTNCYNIVTEFNYMYYLDYDTTNSNLKFKNNRGSIAIPSTNGYLCFTYSSNKLQVIKRYSYSNTAYTHSEDTTFAYLNYYVKYSSGSLILTANVSDASTFVFYNTPMNVTIPTNFNPVPTAYQTNSAVNISDYISASRLDIEGNIPRDARCKFLPYFYSNDGTTKLVSNAGYVYANQLTTPGYDTSTNYYAELMLSVIAVNILTNSTYKTLRYSTNVYKTYREGALKFVQQGDSIANGEKGMNTIPFVYFTCEKDDSGDYNPFMCMASYSITDRIAHLMDICKPPADGSGPYTSSSVTRDATLQGYLVKIPMLNYGFSGDISGSAYYDSATGTTIDSNSNTNNMKANTIAYDFINRYESNGNAQNGQRIYTTMNYNNYNYANTASIGMLIDGVILYPVLNNTLTSAQLSAETSNTGVHVGRGMGLHYHTDGYAAAFAISNNTNNMFLYNNNDFIGRTHPPIVGFGLDGIAIYGTYTTSYTSMSGYSVALDNFGGHSHGDYGYHYHCHNFQNNSSTDINADSGFVTVYQQFVVMKGAYKGNINVVPDFGVTDPASVTLAQTSKYVWGYVRTTP
jgi:hypothetical protein